MDKICSKCLIKKDISEFFKNRSAIDGFRSDCKICHARVVREYQLTDRGQEIALKIERKRTGTPTRCKSHNRANANYVKTPNGRIVNNAASHRRRDRKRGLDSNFSKDDALEVFSRFENKCFVCNAIDGLSIDHHRSLSSGHGLSSQNAVLLCIKCNCRKARKSPEQFYTQEQLEILNGIGVI